MLKKLKNRKKEIVLSLAIILVLTFIGIYVKTSHIYTVETNLSSFLATADYDTTDHVYLSDISYEEDKSYVEPGYYVRLDKSNASSLITLKVGGKKTSFIKGISAWATSELVYDLTKLDHKYDYFTAYLGVDLSQISSYYNSGVTFQIFTSQDGVEWTEKFKTNSMRNYTEDDIPEAVLAKVDISEANYLKLYAYENGNSWYSHWSDDAVYADAKLITKNYQENNEIDETIKPVSYYDNLIKENYTKCSTNACSSEELQAYELNILRRDFTNKVGYDILQALTRYSKDYHTIANWLLNDRETLELFLLGGTPDGNYVSSLKILNELYNKYKSDFELSTPLSSGKTLGNLYEEMAVSLSLTHSANVGLWVTGAPEDPHDPNGSYAIDRYAIYKKLYQTGKLRNNIFENLSVEEMRFVMNNIIDDEEIMWLNEFATINESTDPYRYINYTFDYDYSRPQYYEATNKETYNNKTRKNLKRAYNFTNTYQDSNGKNYSITYGDKAKLWIVFEEGSVCGGLSKTGSNLIGSYGVPSSVVSQPGHAAYIYMNLDAKNNKIWTLYNDVSGWGQSGKTEKLSVRMPNGWGSGSYASGFPASYILLAQAALNDYESYAKAEKTLMLSDIYAKDLTTLESIYEKALSIQDINFDAWYGLVNLYIKKQASASDYLALANRISESLTYYPLPMYDLLELIIKNVPGSEYKAAVMRLRVATLEKAKVATEAESIQAGAVKQVANYLLNSNTDVASFSFDGDNAGKIILSEKFESNDVKWQYNVVNSAQTAYWKDASGPSHELTSDELKQIHEETDIHIRLVGALENVYDIKIDKSTAPVNILTNDYENTLSGTNDKMEWQIEGTDNWTSFKATSPDLTGDKVINIRYSYTANKIASDPITVTFTKDNPDPTQSYVKAERLSIHDVSTEELKRENNAAKNVLDGNYNSMWHTLWDGSDKDKFITLKLDEESYISALEYVPRANDTNGIVTEAKIYTSLDGTTWDEVTLTEEAKWVSDNTAKMAEFASPVKAMYVKLVGAKTIGNYMSASMINLFEDVPKKVPVTADLEYSTKDLTNKDVTVTLVNGNRDFTVTNNDGKLTHTFTKNGDFTYEIKDNYGNTNKITASVNWIDKEAPVASIKYSTTAKTTGPVTATLVSAEDIKITNNNGKNTYTFNSNGSFEFIYEDAVGNTNKTTATVNWITSKSNANSSSSNPNSNSVNSNNSTDNNTNTNSNSSNNNSKPSSGSTTPTEENSNNNTNNSSSSENNQNPSPNNSNTSSDKTTSSKEESKKTYEVTEESKIKKYIPYIIGIALAFGVLGIIIYVIKRND